MVDAVCDGEEPHSCRDPEHLSQSNSEHLDDKGKRPMTDPGYPGRLRFHGQSADGQTTHKQTTGIDKASAQRSDRAMSQLLSNSKRDKCHLRNGLWVVHALRYSIEINHQRQGAP